MELWVEADLVYLITKNGEEILFDYFDFDKEGNSVYLKSTFVIDKLLEYDLPSFNGIPNDWVLISHQLGWCFFIKKKYIKRFKKACKKYAKTEYNHMLKDGMSIAEIVNNFVVPHDGPEVLLSLLKVITVA